MQGRAGRQISRPRPCLSCATCRRRKVRCGRESPECYNCIRLREPCHYDPFQSKEPPVQPNATPVTPQNERVVAGQKESQDPQENTQRGSPVQEDSWNDWSNGQAENEASRPAGSDVSPSAINTTQGPTNSPPLSAIPKSRPELHLSHMPTFESAMKSRSAPLTPSAHSAASNAAAFGYSWDMDSIINDARGFSRDLSNSLEDLDTADFRRKRQRQSPPLPTSGELGTENIKRGFMSSFNFQSSFLKRPSSSTFAEEEVAQSGYLAQRNQTRPQYVEPTFWALISGHVSI